MTVVLIGPIDRQAEIADHHAALTRHGFNVAPIDVGHSGLEILEQVRARDPLLITIGPLDTAGASDYVALVALLRRGAVDCPICALVKEAGPLREELLRRAPGLDGVVQAGDAPTLAALALRVRLGQGWDDLRGTLDRSSPATQMRPDLGLSHASYRWRGAWPHSVGLRIASVRAGLDNQGGSAGRRAPGHVVDELAWLHAEHNVRVFIFEDERFPLDDLEWARELADRLLERGVGKRIIWRARCHAEAVDEALLARLKAAGLDALTIDLRGPAGLLPPATLRRVPALLRRLELRYDLSYPLPPPAGTLERARADLRRLHELCRDGGAPLPGDRAPMVSDVEEDSVLACWRAYLGLLLDPWVRGAASTLAQIRQARFELDLLEHAAPQINGLAHQRERIAFLAGWYNDLIFRMADDSAACFAAAVPDAEQLQIIAAASAQQRWWLEARLAQRREHFMARVHRELAVQVADTWR